MDLKIEGNAHLDELTSVENLLLVTLRGDGEEFGFQQNEVGEKFVSRLVTGACLLTSSEAAVVNTGNMSSVMARLTLGKKYGVLLHGGEALHQAEREIAGYLSKKKLHDLRKTKGLEAGPLQSPHIFSFLFDGTSFGQMVQRMLSICDYISIWPRYWGRWGEHCYVLANAPETTSGVIKRLWFAVLEDK
ncbi:hypothetical protein [Ralstonia flatus]|uniref:Uncharacterized protein n=1 Tax=Ralstonia flatus TaxID=3058601 RepID=A0AAD2FB46_9RALS|nr:hypothetical protein [Ralstonia sp. LMG 32965]MBN6206915.1 hypothetical protein [Ralstonia pickettii]CAJ0896652.1 hypothetical protein R77567_04746 [Ralstonia sp. LMG 32965]CAJ0904679.1 hypothetical protein R77564_05149 [Ralstonia sp. LMG 32965]